MCVAFFSHKYSNSDDSAQAMPNGRALNSLCFKSSRRIAGLGMMFNKNKLLCIKTKSIRLSDEFF